MTATRSRKTRLQRLRDVMADRQFGLCYWCRLPLLAADDPDLGMRTTADHIVRRADGGRTTAANIVAAHFACNTARHNGQDGMQTRGNSGLPLVADPGAGLPPT
jgi:hypothetical protein